jgi:hypothetical protein
MKVHIKEALTLMNKIEKIEQSPSLTKLKNKPETLIKSLSSRSNRSQQ